ncbi:MAG: hypothetical protein IJH47_06360 [Oscillospiraceae bacterium]|nr:hypothetical protein [Oscillospiraceae bacterium]
MREIYRIAEKNIEIASLYGRVHELCRDYRSDGRPDLVVEITRADVDREREQDAAYSEDYLETLAVYRQIADAMPAWDTLLVHGSAIAADGVGYLFTAPSGTGKSTHARLWRQLLGERARMVNDDKPLLRVSGDAVTVFGTPWNGKHHLGENIAVPLRAVCFLERGTENAIAPVAPQEAYVALLRQVYRPGDAAALKKTLELLDRLCGLVAFYRLRCNMDPAAARLSFETMSKEKTK